MSRVSISPFSLSNKYQFLYQVKKQVNGFLNHNIKIKLLQSRDVFDQNKQRNYSALRLSPDFFKTKKRFQ